MLALRSLSQSGGRLLGRLERDTPFHLTDPRNPDPAWRGTVAVTVARELHNEGWIEIDESAPIQDIYVFQISAAGKEHV
jgi:hypothetical protein